jgi:FkbM family methyltransferase
MLGRTTLVPLGPSSQVWAELHHWASSQVAYGSPPDWNEMCAWRRLLSPGDLFVDGGANVGVYSVWAAESGADVIAVEPDPESAWRLLRNMALNEYQVELVCAALSDAPGPVQMTFGLDVGNHLSLGDHGTEVQGTTLDEVLGDRTAAGVKLDLEGAERLAVEGAADALSEHRIGHLQLEWNWCSSDLLGETREPLAKLLRGWGYRLYRPDESGRLQSIDDDAFGPDVFAAAA